MVPKSLTYGSICLKFFSFRVMVLNRSNTTEKSHLWFDWCGTFLSRNDWVNLKGRLLTWLKRSIRRQNARDVYMILLQSTLSVRLANRFIYLFLRRKTNRFPLHHIKVWIIYILLSLWNELIKVNDCRSANFTFLIFQLLYAWLLKWI